MDYKTTDNTGFHATVTIEKTDPAKTTARLNTYRKELKNEAEIFMPAGETTGKELI